MKSKKEIFEKDLREVYRISIERNENINRYLRAISEECKERKEVSEKLYKFFKKTLRFDKY